MEKCKSCLAWERHNKESKLGFCKRHAPKPTIVGDYGEENYKLVWPSTGEDDSCYEHCLSHTCQ